MRIDRVQKGLCGDASVYGPPKTCSNARKVINRLSGTKLPFRRANAEFFAALPL